MKTKELFPWCKIVFLCLFLAVLGLLAYIHFHGLQFSVGRWRLHCHTFTLGGDSNWEDGFSYHSWFSYDISARGLWDLRYRVENFAVHAYLGTEYVDPKIGVTVDRAEKIIFSEYPLGGRSLAQGIDALNEAAVKAGHGHKLKVNFDPQLLSDEKAHALLHRPWDTELGTLKEITLMDAVKITAKFSQVAFRVTPNGIEFYPLE